MKPFIDDVVQPFVVGLGDWSWRWGALLLVLLVALAVWRVRRVATRHLLYRIALVAGLLLPLLPRWGPGFELRAPGDSSASQLAPQQSEVIVPKETKTGAIEVPVADDVPIHEEPVAATSADQLPVAEPLGLWRLALLGVGTFWLSGVLFFAVRRCVGFIALVRLRRGAVTLAGAPAQLLARCVVQLGLRRRVVLASHPRVQSPLALGPSHPMILVPVDWADQPEPVQRACLIHELNHFARYDDSWALLYECVRTLFFFHPLVLWLIARLEIERELLCDEAAVVHGVEPRDYVGMLILFARRPARLGLSRPLAWGKRRTVKVRIQHLLEENMSKRISPLSRPRALTLGLLALTLAVMAGSLRVQADGEKPAVKPDPQANAKREPELPPVDRSLLRYDGLSFEGWRAELRTELKAEKRAQGVKALIAFGIKGYGPEASRTILEIMSEVDRSDRDQQLLWNAGLDILRIGPAAVPIVTEGLESKDLKLKNYAVGALARFQPAQLTEATTTAIKTALPTWLRLISDGDNLKPKLFEALVVLDPKNPDLIAALVQALEAENMATVRSAIKVIGAMKPLPGAKKVVPALIRLLEEDRPELGRPGYRLRLDRRG